MIGNPLGEQDKQLNIPPQLISSIFRWACGTVGTGTVEGGSTVSTGGAVETRVGVARVDVVLAVRTSETRRTLTRILVHPIHTGSTVQTRAVRREESKLNTLLRFDFGVVVL